MLGAIGVSVKIMKNRSPFRSVHNSQGLKPSPSKKKKTSPFPYFITAVPLKSGICYLSICNGHIRPPPIKTKLKTMKNGPIFKTRTRNFFFSTQCIILLLFLRFSLTKYVGGAYKPPPPIKTKVWKQHIKSKVQQII